ncbi:MAG: 30S ribosomal protein S17 [Desulfobulbaceae bacterium]|nr:30S ribosomal protein S17 [Desulfobulbaceae bacterium]MCK5404236.1 30S ribosomal protein S17 [Desulfobulbaceae bacterium]
MADVKNLRKTKVGVVVSNMMDKSIVVKTERMVRHKLYGKIIRRHTKYLAHDPENSCNVGDRVLIEECRPLSKRKRWRIRTIVEKAA